MNLTFPGNPYITTFDIKTVFDLATGKIRVDLSPSVILNPTGITGVKLKIVKPGNGLLLPAEEFQFTTDTLTGEYAFDFPKIQNVFVWGQYQVIATLFLGDDPYELAKDPQNICAVNNFDGGQFDNEGTGEITLTVDCAKGKIYARNFTGYTYRRLQPISENYNITNFYPVESGLAPLKNISVMPFTVDAYVGLNKVAGINISNYDLGDNSFVKVKWVARSQKEVRCGIDLTTIKCALQAKLKRMRACPAGEADYCQEFCEINPLLWLVMVGINEGDDMGDEIERLEELLGVKCECQACAGTKVGPLYTIDCPQVTNAQATIDSGKIVLSFNSANMPAGAKLRVEYREFCDPTTNAAYTLLEPDVTLNGGNQIISITPTEILKYQLRLTTILADGTECVPIIIETDNDGDCPPIIDIIGDGGSNTTTTSTTTSTSTTTVPVTSTTTTVPPATTTTTVPPGTTTTTVPPATTTTTVPPGTTTTTVPPGTTTIPFDTTFEFDTATNQTGFGISGTVGATDPNLAFSFVKKTTTTGTPVTMYIYVGATLEMIIDFPSDYLGTPFRFIDTAGVAHISTFASGNKNF